MVTVPAARGQGAGGVTGFKHLLPFSAQSTEEPWTKSRAWTSRHRRASRANARRQPSSPRWTTEGWAPRPPAPSDGPGPTLPAAPVSALHPAVSAGAAVLTGAKSWRPPQPPAARTARCPPEGRGPRGPSSLARPDPATRSPPRRAKAQRPRSGSLPLARRRVHGGRRTLPPTDAGVRSGSGLSDPGEQDTEPPLARSRGTLRTFPDLSGDSRAGTAEGRDKRAAGRTGPRVGTDTRGAATRPRETLAPTCGGEAARPSGGRTGWSPEAAHLGNVPRCQRHEDPPQHPGWGAEGCPGPRWPRAQGSDPSSAATA